MAAAAPINARPASGAMMAARGEREAPAREDWSSWLGGARQTCLSVLRVVVVVVVVVAAPVDPVQRLVAVLVPVLLQGEGGGAPVVLLQPGHRAEVEELPQRGQGGGAQQIGEGR